MHVRRRLIGTFVGITLFGIVLVGLVTFYNSTKSHNRFEQHLLEVLSGHIIAVVGANSDLLTNSGAIVSELARLSIDNLEIFLKDKAGSLYSTHGDDAHHKNLLPLEYIKELIEGDSNNGQVQREKGRYYWLEAEIPNSAYTLILVRRSDNTTLFGEYQTTFGAPLFVTALVILWISVWGGLITASLFRKIELQKEALHKQASELELAKDRALSANLAKSAFLSGMSHELRTPMNAILGFGQLLQMEALSEQQQESVKEMMFAGNHLLELINEVLDLSKIEAGKLELSLHDFELTGILSECLSLIHPLVEQHQLMLVNNAASSSDFQVRCDRTRLKQVLLNLLSNAVKYNTAGGSITLDCNVASKSRVRISVTDTGPGLTKQQIDKLFQPFERIGFENTDVEGTGIGLVISKRLMEMMGGVVGVESLPGKGSTFWIEITLVEQDETPVPQYNEATNGKTAIGAIDGTGYTVLYIEDDPANLRLVSKLLNDLSNVHLITAQEPQLGLKLARSKQPKLILLDINLPEMDGYEVLAQLKNSGCTREIPVVAVSANAMPCDIKKASEAGFDDYVTKPIDIPNFLAVIDRTLQHKSADQAPFRIN